MSQSKEIDLHFSLAQDLSERFSLTPDQAGFGLTSFSTRDTILGPACPQGGPCSTADQFRSLDGECNNQENPLWGKVSKCSDTF